MNTSDLLKEQAANNQEAIDKVNAETIQTSDVNDAPVATEEIPSNVEESTSPAETENTAGGNETE